MRRRLMPTPLSGLVWLGALAATAALTWVFLREASEFRGVAEDAKQIVSSEVAVEILSMDVQSGKVVAVGDTLVHLRSPELALRIAEIQHDIQNASGDANLNRAESLRRIAELRASFQARRAEYEGEIRTLEAQRSHNRDLIAGFRAMGMGSADTLGADIQDRIKALRNQIQAEEAGMRSQIALLEGSKGESGRLAVSRNEALAAELTLLREQESRLVILATAAGVVDSINYRPGEKASPFAPILTISGHRPTLVRGYVHERVRTTLSNGDSVVVRAVGMRAAKIPGVVVGMGSRIMELPPRLWKVPNFPLWGREVIVRIAPENPLLQGEMVTVERRGLHMGGGR